MTEQTDPAPDQALPDEGADVTTPDETATDDEANETLRERIEEKRDGENDDDTEEE